MARRHLQISATFPRPESETSEPEMSRISQELSAKDTITSSFSNLLRLAIAVNVACPNILMLVK